MNVYISHFLFNLYKNLTNVYEFMTTGLTSNSDGASGFTTTELIKNSDTLDGTTANFYTNDLQLSTLTDHKMKNDDRIILKEGWCA